LNFLAQTLEQPLPNERTTNLSEEKTMKKALSSLFTLLAVVILVSACKKNDDGGGGDTGAFAATPPAAPAQNCATPGNPACTPAQPYYYQQNFPQTQSYQWGYANGYCGCPIGYRPIMNYNWGLSCAPATWFPGYEYYSYGGVVAYNVQSFFYGPQNGQWTSIPQVTYSPAVSGNVQSCGAQATAVCDIRVANSCTGGAICRPAGGGSYLGLCTNGSGNESYSSPTPIGGCMRYTYYGWVNSCTGGPWSY
jgi:hypothetical protein